MYRIRAIKIVIFSMKIHSHAEWFSLIEILIAIFIIALLILTWNQLNFKNLSDSKLVDIWIIQLWSIFDDVNISSLTGKWIGATPQAPKFWKIETSAAASGTLHSFYSFDGLTWTEYFQWQSTFPLSILWLECRKADGTTAQITGSWIIIFEGNSGSLSGCPDAFYKILSLEYGNQIFTWSIDFNMISRISEIN